MTKLVDGKPRGWWQAFPPCSSPGLHNRGLWGKHSPLLLRSREGMLQSLTFLDIASPGRWKNFIAAWSSCSTMTCRFPGAGVAGALMGGAWCWRAYHLQDRQSPGRIVRCALADAAADLQP